MALSIAALGSATVTTLGAQGSSAKTSSTLAGARGLVVDSIRRVVLAGARVVVVGTDRSGVVSDKGEYIIDSIPPGEYTLAVKHPVLDTMGLDLSTKKLTFTADRVTITHLAIPSPATLAAVYCAGAKDPTHPGMVMGKVRLSGTDSAAVGGTVILTWVEVQVSAKVGLKRTIHTLKSTVAKDGFYQFCGLPPRMGGFLLGTYDEAVSGELPVELSDTVGSIGLRSFTIGVANRLANDSAAVPDPLTALRVGSGSISGKVVAKSGNPVGNVTVTVVGSLATATTNRTGEFTLSKVPVGTQTVRVRKVGHAPVAKVIEVASESPTEATITLGESVPELRSVEIMAVSDSALSLVGFNRRRESIPGHYFTAEQIAKLPGERFTDIFANLPGVRIMGVAQSSQYLESSRHPLGFCVNTFLDGVYQPDVFYKDINLQVSRRDIGALEFLQPLYVPIQFTVPERSGCIGILIWTKEKLSKRVLEKK